MGVLSALPLVSVGNACCCMWVVAGGMVAAYLLHQQPQTTIAPGDAALAGLLAGLTGAGVQLVVSVPISLMVAPFERAMLGRALELAGSMPPEFREMVERYSRNGAEFSAGFFVARHLIGLVFWMFIGGIFSTLGGLLGHEMFKKSPPQGGVIDVPSQP